jgi:glycine cleavage system H protein
MNLPSDLKYADTHEWVKVDGDIATIGVSDFAQEQLGDVVFVGLPEVGDALGKGDDAGSIESSKAVGEVIMPFAGAVTEINEKLEDAPELVNSSPYSDGWLFKAKISNAADLDALLSAEKYKEVAVKE